jgi:large subunit ribosomal protein L15e
MSREELEATSTLNQTESRQGGAEAREWLTRSAIAWRREPVIKRVNTPTNPSKARRLGYKNRRGTVVVRVRIRRGGARKPRPVSGRRQKALGVSKFTRAISLRHIAEQRARKRYPNLKIMSSYYLFSDGKNNWFEVILGNRTRDS